MNITDNVHQVRTKTKILHYDSSGNLKYERILEKEKVSENTIDFVVRDCNNYIIQQETGIAARSLAQQWLTALAARIIGANDTGKHRNILSSSASPVANLSMRIDAGAQSSGGIRVGSGSSPVDIQDYYIDFIGIDSSSTDGTLQHSEMTINTPQLIDSSSYKISCSRIFTNNSGNTINITQTALLSMNTFVRYMYMKDLLANNGIPINIPLQDSQSVQFTYNIYFDKSEGWVKAHVYQLYSGLASLSGVNVLNTSGSLGNSGAYGTSTDAVRPNIVAGSNDSSYGIVVGSGSSDIDINNFNVDGKIEHGFSENTLTYGSVNATNLSLIGQTLSFSVSRTFTNNSPSTIDVKNMGIVSQGTGTTNRMLTMNKLTGTISIAPSESINISQKYEMVCE